MAKTQAQKDAEQRNLKPNQFQPGKSGNPNGRPAIPPEVKEAAKAYTMEAIETLLDVMQNSKNDSARVTASVSMLNRGWGAPKQNVEVDVTHQMDITSLLESVDHWRGKQIENKQGQVIEAQIEPLSASRNDKT